MIWINWITFICRFSCIYEHILYVYKMKKFWHTFWDTLSWTLPFGKWNNAYCTEVKLFQGFIKLTNGLRVNCYTYLHHRRLKTSWKHILVNNQISIASHCKYVHLPLYGFCLILATGVLKLFKKNLFVERILNYCSRLIYELLIRRNYTRRHFECMGLVWDIPVLLLSDQFFSRLNSLL